MVIGVLWACRAAGGRLGSYISHLPLSTVLSGEDAPKCCSGKLISIARLPSLEGSWDSNVETIIDAEGCSVVLHTER